ncbi:MAG: hypothetical protein EBX35_03985 [Planctomycetia bacterium]|nr:hypothetical protein [Planctomycetia bacterium]
MPTPRTRRDLGRFLWMPLLAAAWSTLAPSAGHAADYESWSKVEGAQQTRDYGQQIKEGKFDADQKTFVETTLLPQLGLEANRTAIAAVRQRIRDVALRGATKKEVVDQANAAIRDGMLRLVADKNAELLVRVNAMLLVGELQDLDRAPWPGGLAPLTKAAGDAALPLAIRVAALNGLAQHVAAAGAGGPAATAAAPVVGALVTSPPEGDAAAVRWLVSRALDLLLRVPAQPQAVAAAARMLADGQADLDLRVRAAAAVGGLAKADSGVDAAAAVAQIKSLAITALSADLDAAEDRRFFKKVAGSDPLSAGGVRGGLTAPPAANSSTLGPGGFFGGQGPGDLGGGLTPAVADEDAVQPLACRRNAWRLFTLAEAIKPARSGAGLAGLLAGAAATAATDLATDLREAAIDLDKRPDEATLEAALAKLREVAPTGAPVPGPGQPAGTGAAAKEASPFDQPAGNSPF